LIVYQNNIVLSFVFLFYQAGILPAHLHSIEIARRNREAKEKEETSKAEDEKVEEQ